MLKRLYVDNYKCLVDFEVRLGEFTLLVGRNGSGKTAVLDAVYALCKVLQGRFRISDIGAFQPATLTRWQSRDIQSFELDVELDRDQFTYSLELEHDRTARRALIKEETLSVNGGPLFRFVLGDVQLYRDDYSKGPTFKGDRGESALATVAPDGHNGRLCRFMDFMRDVLVCGLNPANIGAEAAGEVEYLARDGGNFVNWYRHLTQERQDLAHEHIQLMKEVLDGLQTFRLEKIGIDTKALVGVFGGNGQSQSLSFREFTDGQRALTILYALVSLATKPGRTLLIDGPANSVGLSEIQPWLIALLDECGYRIRQAVLASHHPEVLDYVGADRALLFTRDGVGPTRVEPMIDRVRHFTDDGILRLSQVVARGAEV